MEKSHLNELIERSKRNDEKAFRLIVEGYQSMIYSLVMRILCNEDEAKDTVQDTFIRAWLNLEKFDSEKTFSTWLYKIATNLCLDKLKSSKHKYENSKGIEETIYKLVSDDNPQAQLENSELIDIIQLITNELTPKQRIVFNLRYLEELEITEIVSITGLTADKIKSNLYLARQTVKSILNKIQKHGL